MNVSYNTNFIYVPEGIYKPELEGHYLKSKRAYRLPNNPYAWQQLYQTYRQEAYKLMYQKKMQGLYKIKAFKKQKDIKGDKRLRPYQRVDVEYIRMVKNAGVFNEMRTGKTPTSLVAYTNEERLLIVAPASILFKWAEEVKTWTDFTPIVCHGDKRKRRQLWKDFNHPKTALIVSYGTLRNDVKSDLVPNITYSMIVDEAHRLANPRSQQSQAVFQVGRKAKKRLALTGTPTQNKGTDVWGILHYLYPDKFLGYWQFVERYFKTWESPWGTTEIAGYKPYRKNELQDMLETFSVQRKRAEVMKWLPKVQKITFDVEMSKKQRKHYDEMLKFFETEHVDAPNLLVQLLRLSQITLAPELLDLESPSAKEDFILEYLEDNKEPVIIFSQFTTYLKKLSKKIKEKHALIHGSVGKEERSQIANDFQAGKFRIILANIVSAGEGLTLDRASEVIFLDRHPNPAKNDQAEDRIIPTTKESNQRVTVIDIVAKDSVDERIQKLLKEKRDITNVVNNYRNIAEFLRG